MAGYNKGIVDTRKLNNDKASLGRGGDTEIREVDNQESHVTALEAYLIDVNGKAGEEYAKRIGAGTVNPLTGMPEYNPGEKTYEELSSMSPSEYEEYLASMGVSGEITTYNSIFGETYNSETTAGTRQFVGDLGDISDDPTLNYIQQQQELTTGSAGNYLGIGAFKGSAETNRDLSQTQLEATKGFTEQAIGLQSQFAEKGLGRDQKFAMERAGSQYQAQSADLASGLASGQRASGRGLAQARAGAQSAAGRSGLARGSAQTSFESQESDLMSQSRDMSKQYQVGRAQATAGLGMAQRQSAASYELGMQQTAATKALGMAEAGSAYDIGMAGTTADYESSIREAGVIANYKTDLRKTEIMDSFYRDMSEYGDPNLKVLSSEEVETAEAGIDWWYDDK